MKHTPVSANATDQLITSAEVQELIRNRAYEIYEQNGKREGFAEQDWVQAEAEVLDARSLKAAA